MTALDKAVEAFLKFDGAVAVDGVPLENIQVSPPAISAAIQAWLNHQNKDVGSCAPSQPPMGEE